VVLNTLYAVALIMMIFAPKLFVGLAFDSGGVSGGALTSAFLTPLTLGWHRLWLRHHLPADSRFWSTVLELLHLFQLPH